MREHLAPGMKVTVLPGSWLGSEPGVFSDSWLRCYPTPLGGWQAFIPVCAAAGNSLETRGPLRGADVEGWDAGTGSETREGVCMFVLFSNYFLHKY